MVNDALALLRGLDVEAITAQDGSRPRCSHSGRQDVEPADDSEVPIACG